MVDLIDWRRRTGLHLLEEASDAPPHGVTAIPKQNEWGGFCIREWQQFDWIPSKVPLFFVHKNLTLCSRWVDSLNYSFRFARRPPSTARPANTGGHECPMNATMKLIYDFPSVFANNPKVTKSSQNQRLRKSHSKEFIPRVIQSSWEAMMGTQESVLSRIKIMSYSNLADLISKLNFYYPARFCNFN